MGKIYSNYCVGEHFEGGETLGIARKLTPANRGRILRNQGKGGSVCLKNGSVSGTG